MMGNHCIDCDYCGKDTRGLSGVKGCDTPEEASRCIEFKEAKDSAPGHGQAMTCVAGNLVKTLRPFEDLYQQALEKGHDYGSTCEWRVAFNDLHAAHEAYEEALGREAGDMLLADEVDAKADTEAAVAEQAESLAGRVQVYEAKGWVAHHVEKLIDAALANIKTEYEWYHSGATVPRTTQLMLECIDRHVKALWHEVKANRGADKTAEVNARYVAVHAILYMNHTAGGFFGLDNALGAVRTEAMQATARFDPMNSPHEAYAVLLEEVDELNDEYAKGKGRSVDAGAEARQVAAMAVRYLVDICSGVRRV